jgi:thiamine transporter ThiT
VDPRLKRTAATGLFAALALALNFPLLGVPNVELFSVCLFIAGVYLGYWGGIVTPLIAGVIFVFFNPNGPPSVITLVIAQLVGFVLFGLAGAIFGKSILRNKNHMVGMVFSAAIGVVFTFIYDALTNAAIAVTFGPFWPTMISGIAFSLMHIVSNGIIFGLVEPLMVKLWQIVEPRLYPAS